MDRLVINICAVSHKYYCSLEAEKKMSFKVILKKMWPLKKLDKTPDRRRSCTRAMCNKSSQLTWSYKQLPPRCLQDVLQAPEKTLIDVEFAYRRHNVITCGDCTKLRVRWLNNKTNRENFSLASGTRSLHSLAVTPKLMSRLAVLVRKNNTIFKETRTNGRSNASRGPP